MAVKSPGRRNHQPIRRPVGTELLQQRRFVGLSGRGAAQL